jgi:branched-chain amino acid transport system permease protein
VVNGLSLGLLFALIALGFMLIVGVMEVINLAHGSLFALGAYVALQMLGPVATPAKYALVLVAAPLAVAAFGMLLELCMRRTYGAIPSTGCCSPSARRW